MSKCCCSSGIRVVIIGAVAAGTSAAAKARRNNENAEIVIYEKDSFISYCNKGVTGNATQNILLGRGLKKVYNLSGGQKQYRITHKEQTP